MGLVLSIVYLVVHVLYIALLGRLVLDWVQMFARGWRPKGMALVAASTIYSLTDPPMKALRRLKREAHGSPVPSIIFTKGGGHWLEAIADAGSDAVGLDWTVNLAQARRRVGDRVALQGNLDPMVLFAAPAIVSSIAFVVFVPVAFVPFVRLPAWAPATPENGRKTALHTKKTATRIFRVRSKTGIEVRSR